MLANFEDAMKDPHGKGPALLRTSKKIFDSLEFAGKANVTKTKTKNKSEKNESDARRLSSCVDYPGWKDADEWGCEQYSQFSSAAELKHGCMEHKRLHRQQRIPAEDACCAWGRNRRNRRNASRKASRLCSYRRRHSQRTFKWRRDDRELQRKEQYRGPP